MGPGERNIQHELRRQAAHVAVPTDMWENISGRLDGKRAQAQRQRQVTTRSAQWKPALALGAAVAMLWLTVAPSAVPSPAPEAIIQAMPQPDVASSGWGHDTLQVRFYRRAGYDIDSVPPEARGTLVDGTDELPRQSPRTMAVR